MIREQVLREWNNLKAKMISYQAATLSPPEMEFFESIAGNLFSGVLPLFPNNYHWSILERHNEAAQVEKTELISQLANLKQALGREVNDSLQLLELAHSNKVAMYTQLVANWKAAQNGGGGPTIEYDD